MQYHIKLLIVFAIFFLIYAARQWLICRNCTDAQGYKTNDIRAGKFQDILRRAFPSSFHEIPKFAAMRAIFGLVLLVRAGYQWYYIMPMDLADPMFMAALIATTVFSVFITFGFMTTVSLTAMVLIMFGERPMRSSTLGNDIAAILSIMLVFCGAHQAFSLDRFIAKKWAVWHALTGNRFVTATWREMPDQMSMFKFVAVLSYWCLCLYSAFKHYAEPSWMSSDASVWLLTSSFIAEQYGFFRSLFETPVMEDVFRYSMWLMFPWYMIFLPAFFIGGWIQRFNLIWWFTFLLLSSRVLQLGSLGEIEIVFFIALVFCPTKRPKETIQFYYDSKCNLCARTVAFVRGIDITRHVRFISAQAAKKHLKKNGISLEDALKFLAGEYKGQFYQGYNLYCLVSRKTPLLWPAFPILWLGKITGIGPKIYQKIADNRIKMFGVCQIPVKPRFIPQDFQGWSIARPSILATRTTICAFALLFLTFPPIGIVYEGEFFSHFKKYYRAADILGIAPINVFNKVDLQMSSHWRVIEYCPPKGSEKAGCDLVPLTGWDGERLAYHASDSVYYGGTLKWRRHNIEEGALCDYGGEGRYQTEILHQFAGLYMRLNDLQNGDFKVTYFYHPLPELSDPEWHSHWDKAQKVCERKFSITPTGEAVAVR